MNRIENEQKKRLNDMLSMVRVSGIIFIGIAVMNYLPIQKIQIGIAIDVVFCIYAWLDLNYIHKHPRMWVKPSWSDYAEAVIWAAASTYIIYLTGGRSSVFKMIYAFIIITESFQFGIVFGFLPATLSTVGLIAVDIISTGPIQRNVFVEGDMVMIGIFFLLAWMMGYFGQEEKSITSRLVHMADTDDLTGLYNHRMFQESLSQIIIEAHRGKRAFWIMLMDIDHFRYYNQTYGHEAGDNVLKALASLIASKLPEALLLARYGGDEFAVVLNDMPDEQLLSIGQRISNIISQHAFPGMDMMPNGRLSISMGAAHFPKDGSNKAALLRATEDALLRSKNLKNEGVELYFSILDELKKEANELESQLLTTIKSLISIINVRDRYTYGHTERVVMYATWLAYALGFTEQQVRSVQYGAYLHDVGKIQVDERILTKPGKLTDEEWRILQQHPIWGVEIIKPIEFLNTVAPMILHHHERWDGKGYPDALKGKDIPLEARLLTLVDAYDAMTTDRPYKQAMTTKEAIEEILANAGTQFDPYLASVFIKVLEQRVLFRQGA